MTNVTRDLRQMVAVLAALGLAAPAAVLAADRDTTGSGTSAQETGAAESGAKPDRKLDEGVQKLHAGNHAEVVGAQQAQQLASSADVKAFAQRLVDDHTQLNQQLAEAVQPTKLKFEGKAYDKAFDDQQKKMSKIERKTGAAFDRAYVELMVQDHEKDAKDVKKLSETARKDGRTDLASVLDQAEQKIQGHLAEARQLASALKSQRSTASSSTSASGSGSSSDSGSSRPAK